MTLGREGSEGETMMIVVGRPIVVVKGGGGGDRDIFGLSPSFAVVVNPHC
jgi:hypothetical protein